MQNPNNSNNYPSTESSKFRGKAAIDILHKGILKEDERRIDIKISDVYEVDLEEAKEIHINYHCNKMQSFLSNRIKRQGMTKSFVDKIEGLDPYLQTFAYQVSMGELIEMAAVDLLYKEFQRLVIHSYASDSNITREEDRYISFYG